MAKVNDTTAISNYAGQYERKIITSIVNGLDIAEDVTVIRNLKAPKNLPKYTGNKGLRPNNTNIEEPKGQAGKFSVRKLTPRVGMKIFRVIPEELRDTYLSEQLSPNAKDYPGGFAEYFWQEQIKTVQAEINDNCYNSIDSTDIPEFDAGATYAVGNRVLYKDDFWKCLSATSAGQTPETHPAKWEEVNNSSIVDGFGTIIKAEYAGMPSSQKIATGAITSSNAYDKVVGFFASLPAVHKKRGGTFFVGFDLYTDYMLHVQNKFTAGSSFLDAEDEVGGYIYGSGKKWRLKPCTWMGSSRRIIATQKENLYMGTDLTSDMNSLGNIVPTLHGYKAIMKMILAFEIADLSALFLNDQE